METTIVLSILLLVTFLKPGRVMFEIAGVSEEVAKEALRLATHKLPCKCKIVSKADNSLDPCNVLPYFFDPGRIVQLICCVLESQIEAARIAMTRYIKRGGKVWIKIFPDKPVTAKPAETEDTFSSFLFLVGSTSPL